MVKLIKKENVLPLENYQSGLIFILKNKGDLETLQKLTANIKNSEILSIFGDFQILYDKTKWDVVASK